MLRFVSGYCEVSVSGFLSRGSMLMFEPVAKPLVPSLLFVYCKRTKKTYFVVASDRKAVFCCF